MVLEIKSDNGNIADLELLMCAHTSDYSETEFFEY